MRATGPSLRKADASERLVLLIVSAGASPASTSSSSTSRCPRCHAISERGVRAGYSAVVERDIATLEGMLGSGEDARRPGDHCSQHARRVARART